MSSKHTAHWDFLEQIPGRPNASGDITRLFNTGDSRPPRSFARLLDRSEEGSISAAIYGREGIANCVDASVARLEGSGPFGLDIRFRRLDGAHAGELWQILDLATLAERADHPSVERKELGLGPNDCLSSGPTSPLRILTVQERRGGGMPGGLDNARSVLVRALLNVGEAQVMEGSAGSYGYGKAAVAQASRIRVVLAYTCAPPTADDSVTRRLLGVTYWGMHDTEDRRFTGWALFGEKESEHMAALEDEAADRIAESLGLPIRDPSVEADRGTTFVLIDPMFDARELRGAIELFWWPLLQQSRSAQFDIVIEDEHGNVLRPKVDESHPELGQFIRRFRQAEDARDNSTGSLSETAITHIGEAGITALESREPESPIEGSLIAKMRSPLMVVSYDTNSRANPPVIGVFVAHDTTNEHLRRVEPPEHDKWHARNVGGLNATPEDLRISRLVRSEIETSVNALRAPDPPPVHGIAAFSKFFPAVDAKAARPRPPRPPHQRRQRLVRVHLVHDTGNDIIEVDRPSRLVNDDGTLSATAEVKFFLDEARAAKLGKKYLDATITIGAQIHEDGTRGEWWPATVRQHRRAGETIFTKKTDDAAIPSIFEGRFHVGESIHFVIDTGPYHPDWTIDMNFDCSPWDVAEPTGARLRDDEEN